MDLGARDITRAWGQESPENKTTSRLIPNRRQPNTQQGENNHERNAHHQPTARRQGRSTHWPHKPKSKDQPEEVLGTLIAIRDWSSDFREEDDRQYVIQAADAVWSVVTNTVRLRDEFEEKDPAIGDTVSVRSSV